MPTEISQTLAHIKIVKAKFNSLLKILKPKGNINGNQSTNMYANLLTNPLFCAKSKVQKESNPIRHVVSFFYCPTHSIAKKNSETLKPLDNIAPQRLAGSEQIIQDLNNLIIPTKISMVSFDVKNLFMSLS